MLGPTGGVIDSISTLILLVTSFYIPVYLYNAMRRIYRQGHLITLAKYLMLSFAYVAGTAFMMLGALFFALLSA